MTIKIEVFPGDEVAVEEEYLAAEGTFASDGKVYAAQAGALELDDEEYTARVVTPNPPNVLKEGDIVYAIVGGIRKTMAIAEVVASDGTRRGVTGDTNGTIHVSKISPGYTEDVGRELRTGDIVRARVISVDPSVQLTTRDDHLGVVRSMCGECKTELEVKGKGLYCPECKQSSPRKLADDYGDVTI